MELTSEERQAVENGDVVKYVIPGSRIECFVVRHDLLDTLLARLDYSACDADDLATLTAAVLPDEDIVERLICETPPPVIPKYEK
jgi:hypothetical protein